MDEIKYYIAKWVSKQIAIYQRIKEIIQLDRQSITKNRTRKVGGGTIKNFGKTNELINEFCNTNELVKALLVLLFS